MKRTRRAALAMLAGSSGLLAVDTFGFSSGRLERDVAVDVVSDANAYLGLVDREDTDGVETGGVLFEETADGDRYPPVSFTVVNQLSESISVALSLVDDRIRFEPGDGAELDGERGLAADLGVGETIDVAIDLAVSDGRPDEGSITTSLEIEAEGEATRIDAERTLTLVADVFCVIDVGWLPGSLLVVRRRQVDGEPRTAVEWIDCAAGKSAIVGTLPPIWESKLRLAFPEADDTETDSQTSGFSMQSAGTGTGSDSESGSEPEPEISVETADGVEATVETGADTGSDSASDAGSDSASDADSDSESAALQSYSTTSSGSDETDDGSSEIAVEIDTTSSDGQETTETIRVPHEPEFETG